VKGIGCHLLAAPGHKGLMGPLGTGVLYVAPGIEDRLLPVRQGGTGTRSDEDVQPISLPERYESGNLNVPGIAGLEAGVTAVMQIQPSAGSGLDALVQTLLMGLSDRKTVQVFGPGPGQPRTSVVSLNVSGFDPQELAALLDAQWSIQTRAGLHCAPRMHAALGTLPHGTLRVSLGHLTEAEDIQTLLSALADLAE
jgi:cysteine desulfurase / selenocysteine lyase